MPLWIAFTLLAVIMQPLRTAGQRQLTGLISAPAATLVRYLFGLPFAALYFLLQWQGSGGVIFTSSSQFFLLSSLAGLSQILATFLLLKTLMLRNFAVGTALAKTQALLAAILGVLFFDEPLGLLASLSVLLGVAGVLIASNWSFTLSAEGELRALVLGLGAGLFFALTSWFAREASLTLAGPRLLSAAAVLLYCVALQTAVCLVWVVRYHRASWVMLASNQRACWFIGFTSLAGSIGWFTANSLQNPALVNTLGQLEFFVTLLITLLYFKERISLREAVGLMLLLASLLLLAWVS
jgi:drug/metabolite transporter (DMT)-like permease